VVAFTQEVYKSTPADYERARARVTALTSHEQELSRLVNKDSYIVKMRGIPFYATEAQITEFLQRKAQPHEIIKIHIIFDRLGRANGHVYVEVPDEDVAQRVLELNKKNLGHRYIEISMSNAAELISNLCLHNSQGALVNPSHVLLKMRGLPFSAQDQECIDFFAGSLHSFLTRACPH
jgi:heterogeneous nuclear ribonucleoprotein F/H